MHRLNFLCCNFYYIITSYSQLLNVLFTAVFLIAIFRLFYIGSYIYF